MAVSLKRKVLLAFGGWILFSMMTASCGKGANPAAPQSYVKVHIFDAAWLNFYLDFDDRFEVQVDGVALGQTSSGVDIKTFEGNLETGSHTLRVVWTAGPDRVGTYGIALEGARFSDGTDLKTGNLYTLSGYHEFEITVP